MGSLLVDGVHFLLQLRFERLLCSQGGLPLLEHGLQFIDDSLDLDLLGFGERQFLVEGREVLVALGLELGVGLVVLLLVVLVLLLDVAEGVEEPVERLALGKLHGDGGEEGLAELTGSDGVDLGGDGGIQLC